MASKNQTARVAKENAALRAAFDKLRALPSYKAWSNDTGDDEFLRLSSVERILDEVPRG